MKVLARCLREARLSVMAIYFLRFLAGAALALSLPGHANGLTVAVTGALWVLAIFFTYLFNGVMDIEEDQVNGSSRPIARGALPRRTALWAAWSAAAISVIGGISLGPRTVIPLVVVIALGYLYSAPPFMMKRYSSTTALITGIAGLAAYYLGFISVGREVGTVKEVAVILVFALSAQLWTMGVGVLTKDLPDIEGDAAAGRRTIAVKQGDRRVRKTICYTAFLTAALFVAVATALELPLIQPEIVMLVGAVAVSVTCLSSISDGDRDRRRRPFRAFLATQYSVQLSAAVPAVLAAL